MRKLGFPQLVGLLIALGSACTTTTTPPPGSPTPVAEVVGDTTVGSPAISVVEPPVPVVDGAGLPAFVTDSDIYLDDTTTQEEINCDDAEELSDWGEYEAGDRADYCDYGPDPGELPEEFDWAS